MYTISHNYETHIVQKDHPALRKISPEVPPEMFGSDTLRDIISRMITALEAEPDGVAIACPQIGENWRIFVVHRRAFAPVDDDGFPEEKLPKQHLIVINPKIIKVSQQKQRVPEGCLSVRWLFGTTERYVKATIEYQDEIGKIHSRGASGLMAQIFQHEIEHLNGVLFCDHASALAEMSDKEIREVKKAAEHIRTLT
jgi:peptide deformylase